MRIGIMLRAYDESGGIGVYTRNLVRELLEIDQKNHYVFFFVILKIWAFLLGIQMYPRG